MLARKLLHFSIFKILIQKRAKREQKKGPKMRQKGTNSGPEKNQKLSWNQPEMDQK